MEGKNKIKKVNEASWLRIKLHKSQGIKYLKPAPGPLNWLGLCLCTRAQLSLDVGSAWAEPQAPLAALGSVQRGLGQDGKDLCKDGGMATRLHHGFPTAPAPCKPHPASPALSAPSFCLVTLPRDPALESTPSLLD